MSDVRVQIYQQLQSDNLDNDYLSKLYTLYDTHLFGGALGLQTKSLNLSLKFGKTGRNVGIVKLLPQSISVTLSRNMQIYTTLYRNINPMMGLHLIFEQILIHLIMIVMSGKYEESEYYELYLCLYKKYFGSIDFVTYKNILVTTGKLGHYEWKSNSCYIDSLLLVLFYSSDIWINIFKTFHNSHIVNQLLVSNYKDLVDGENIDSLPIRRALLDQLPDMKCGGRWTFYEVERVYATLCDLFPSLKSKVPFAIYKNDRFNHIERIDQCVFQMADFLEIEEVEDSGAKVLWNLIPSDFIVFHNGGIPAITDFTQGKEVVRQTIYENGYPTFRDVSMVKRRGFSHRILSKYDLIGVVILEGAVVGEDSGTHYVSYFKSKFDGKWYFYNDIVGIRELEELPDTVFREEDGSKPVMYFYQRF